MVQKVQFVHVGGWSGYLTCATEVRPPAPPLDKFWGVLNFWLHFTASGLYAVAYFREMLRPANVSYAGICSRQKHLKKRFTDFENLQGCGGYSLPNMSKI